MAATEGTTRQRGAQLQSTTPTKLLKRPATSRWEKDEDLELMGHDHDKHGRGFLYLLAFQSVGVVYGDLGTSPLYTFANIFTDNPSEQDVVGATSLIVWTLISLVAIKYAIIVLRADDAGNGGTFALFSQLRRAGELARPDGEALPSDKELTHYQVGRPSMSSKGSTGLTSPFFTRKSSGPGTSPLPAIVPPTGATLADPSSSSATDSTAPATSPLNASDFVTLPGTPGKALAAPPTWRDHLIGHRWVQRILRVMVVIAVGAIMGDGVLTPAISVVSACEGLQVPVPSFPRGAIDGMSIGILVLLFAIQRYGTKFVGAVFSPIVTLWLLANMAVGLYNIFHHHPAILKAMGPNYLFDYLVRNGREGWESLGSVLFCVTGAEALFADLGHFNRKAIQLSAFTLLMPSLVISYLGEGAYLIKHPEDYALTFWKSLPHGTFWPMFIIATLAAIVASQALISAVFQIVYQAITQGFFPRLQVLHTSEKHFGQVYVPIMNFVLFALCLIVVGAFKSSANIGKAYGVSVMADMLFTTHFMVLIMLCVWRTPIWCPILFYAVFAPIEGAYLSSVLLKVPTGGWFSLMLAGVYAVLMLLTGWGNIQKGRFFKRGLIPNLEQYLSVMKPDKRDEDRPVQEQLCVVAPRHKQGPGSTVKVQETPGVGLYYSEFIYGVPPVLVEHMASFPVVHQVNIFVTNRFCPCPRVLKHERLLIEQLGVRGFYHAICRYGYTDVPQQSEGFVTGVLETVRDMLYATLREYILHSESLQQLFPPPPDMLPTRASESGPGPSRPMVIPEGAPLKDGVVGSAPSATSNPSSWGDTATLHQRSSLRSVARAARPLTSNPGSLRPFADLDLDPSITQIDGEMSLPANMRGTASLPATVRSAAAFRKMVSLNATNAEDSLGAATRTARDQNEHSLPARLRSLDKMGVTFGNSEESVPLSVGRRMGAQLVRARMPGPLGSSLHSIISTDLQEAPIDLQTRAYLDEMLKRLDERQDLVAASPDMRQAKLLALEIKTVMLAIQEQEVVYVMGRAHVRLRKHSNYLRRYFAELPYQILVNVLQHDASTAYGIPATRLCEVGLPYEV
ncbi:hypothetical protein WJX84_006444 [Apatococcus fuscideae]|uniref:Potassium transporter n=1 Tax=Apatococcus fuscideae TaxID=2026836 RepID=A0AAW1TCX0_9CHLO